eukprot:8131208-Heterocapsa_arctica.AAC.1
MITAYNSAIEEGRLYMLYSMPGKMQSTMMRFVINYNVDDNGNIDQNTTEDLLNSEQRMLNTTGPWYGALHAFLLENDK